MTFATPTAQQLAALAAQCGLSLAEGDIGWYQALLAGSFEGYRLMDRLPDEIPRVTYPRTPGHRPDAQEDPLNAWYRKTSVKGAASGPLLGKRIALKDNVQLAGVAMMNGTAILDGFVPEFDATIVTRMLDAGAEIVGKAHCESLCLAAHSHSNDTGPVHNPHRHGWSAAGSSSGSAAVVAAGEADMAIGGDQGGSIRMPAALCGIVGLKPTHGLVPYTGVMPIEITVDHVGPMTANVADNALLLEVIAGDDGIDPRQRAIRVQKYTEALGQNPQGLRVGLLKEGFEAPGMDPVVSECVRAAAARMAELGMVVQEVSLPLHAVAGLMCRPILTEGAARTLFWGDGAGGSRDDLYSVALMDRFRQWRQRADDLSDSAKLILMAGTHVNNLYGGRYYAKAINVARRLRAAYDTLLQQHDLLLMPTTPTQAIELPGPGTDRATTIAQGFGLTVNTLPFDVTHHPAMSVPCGKPDGLPVGMMLVGRHFDEATLYRAAHAFEQSGDWTRC